MDAQNSDLIFNVAQLLKEPVGSRRNLDLRTAELTLDSASDVKQSTERPLKARDLEGKAKATRINDGLLVVGDVAAAVEMECGRCLENFDFAAEGTLEEQFRPTIDVETGAPVQRADYEENDAVFDIDANHMMDLSEPVRQAILVALPMKPLCREDCKGLCPNCGANWNDGLCDCTPEQMDNHWVGLRELRLEDFPAGDITMN